MITAAQLSPLGPVTAAAWEEMGESERRIEVVDGFLHVGPSPTLLHQRVVFRLTTILTAACPPELHCGLGVDVRLSDEPLNVRWPDVLVLRSDVERVRADVVVLAVEVVSPGSRTIDRIHKRHDYAAAGIPCYWVLDPSGGQVRLMAYRFGEEMDWTLEEGGCARLEEPFPVRIDLASLVQP